MHVFNVYVYVAQQRRKENHFLYTTRFMFVNTLGMFAVAYMKYTEHVKSTLVQCDGVQRQRGIFHFN